MRRFSPAGEMSAHQPVAEGSLQTRRHEVLSPSLRFRDGVELLVQLGIDGGREDIRPGHGLLVPCRLDGRWGTLGVVRLNALGESGEAEFWLAAIKGVVIVIVFVLSGVFMIAGVMGGGACQVDDRGRPSTTVSWACIAVFMIANTLSGHPGWWAWPRAVENPRGDVPALDPAPCSGASCSSTLARLP